MMLEAGNNPPEDIFVVIEILANRTPAVKYELDKEHGVLMVDRFVGTSMAYPCHYGFIPGTLGDDGDPLDALLLIGEQLTPGVVVPSRPIGMLVMEDESGQDEKILAVPTSKVTKLYESMQDVGDIPAALSGKIEHFFKHYKDLEKGKWVKVKGFEGKQAAQELITKCIAKAKAPAA